MLTLVPAKRRGGAFLHCGALGGRAGKVTASNLSPEVERKANMYIILKTEKAGSEEHRHWYGVVALTGVRRARNVVMPAMW